MNKKNNFNSKDLATTLFQTFSSNVNNGELTQKNVLAHVMQQAKKEKTKVTGNEPEYHNILSYLEDIVSIIQSKGENAEDASNILDNLSASNMVFMADIYKMLLEHFDSCHSYDIMWRLATHLRYIQVRRE